jgi:hypothetical protein
MASNPPVNICIIIAWLFPIAFAQPVVRFVEEILNCLRFEGQRANNRDRKFVPTGWAHLGEVIATNLIVSSENSVSFIISNEVIAVVGEPKQRTLW